MRMTERSLVDGLGCSFTTVFIFYEKILVAYMRGGNIKQLTFILPKLRSALATDSGCDYFEPANMQKIEIASKLYP